MDCLPPGCPLQVLLKKYMFDEIHVMPPDPLFGRTPGARLAGRVAGVCEAVFRPAAGYPFTMRLPVGRWLGACEAVFRPAVGALQASKRRREVSRPNTLRP